MLFHLLPASVAMRNPLKSSSHSLCARAETWPLIVSRIRKQGSTISRMWCPVGGRRDGFLCARLKLEEGQVCSKYFTLTGSSHSHIFGLERAGFPWASFWSDAIGISRLGASPEWGPRHKKGKNKNRNSLMGSSMSSKVSRQSAYFFPAFRVSVSCSMDFLQPRLL